jgi:hypothetical protein
MPKFWNIICLGFEVLTLMVIDDTVFWDITPCSPLKLNRSLAETYLHLQGRSISQQNFACFLPTSSWFFCLAYSTILKIEAEDTTDYTALCPGRHNFYSLVLISLSH